MNQKQFVLKLPKATVYLVASEKGLQEISWKKQAVKTASDLTGRDPVDKILKRAATQLKEYFSGKRTTFDLPLDVQGTPFQKRVWSELGKIPFGKVCTYGDIAKKLKQPTASRAVGRANSKNPVSVVVPCHRVVPKAGAVVGGYAGTPAVKKFLLELEGHTHFQ